MPTKPRLPSGASEASRAGIPPSSPSPATTGSSGVGRPGHKERRGKVKRPFFYLEEDFLRARTFAAWDDLRSQVRQWLDTVANVRVHGTTRRRVDEAYAEERPCLIALPPVDYPAERRETRTVQKDGRKPDSPDPVAPVRVLLERLNLTTAARRLSELLAHAETAQPSYSAFLR
jgi:hypothetical protein